MYQIKDYSYDRIEELNKTLNTDVFSIKPAKNKKKKIDVFAMDKKIATIGDSERPDYPTYMLDQGQEFADKRQKAFFSRFRRLPDIKNGKITTIFWSRFLLW